MTTSAGLDVSDKNTQIREQLAAAHRTMTNQLRGLLKLLGLRLGAVTTPHKRARVALARKLAILIHRLWQSETEFRWA